jgi:hypothetical protein
MSLRRTLLLSGGASGGAGQTGRIHIDGRMFRDEHGAAWLWRGCTAFTLYLLWLTGGASAVDAVLADWFTAAGSSPFTVVRVLGMVNSFAHLWPQEHADYYDQLQPFVRYLFSRWAVRIEFVIFADSGDILGNGDIDPHAQRVAGLIADEPNVFIEVANEPSQHTNLNGGDQKAYEIYLSLTAPGRMIATGAYSWEQPGDYLTDHTPREDWVRKANDLKDGCEATNRPTVGDEPIGAAEVAIPGKRDNVPSKFAQYAAIAAMNGSGSTFHSDNGILCQPFQPVQRDCAAAFFAAAAWPPPETQLAPYNRGGSVPGCHWPFGPSICEHDDSVEVRTFAKILEPLAWVCQVETQRTAPTPCPGWAVDAPGPSIGLTVFKRV